MERAPLRPLPSRPPSPVNPAEAIRHVTAELSTLDAPAAEALALVALAGRSRDELAGERGLSSEELAEALARARKALRRRLHPLPGSGWCERAERLISDRIDDALEDPGPARLEVHLANCSRCVEHERRLAQAHDALVSGFVESLTPAPEGQPRAEAGGEPEAPEEPASAPAAALRIVDAAAKAKDTSPVSESTPEPDEGGGPAQAVEPPTLDSDPPIALPPADASPALPEPEDPPALPDPEDAPAIAETPEPPAIMDTPEPPAIAGTPEPPAIMETPEPPAIAETPEPPAIAETEEPPAIAETKEPPALRDVEEPPAIAEAEDTPAEAGDRPAIPSATEPDEQPATKGADSLAEVVPIETAARAPAPAPSVSRPPLDRGQPLPSARPAPGSGAPVQPLRRPAPPSPRWAMLAATYPALSPPDSSRPPASDDTLAAVVPLLVIGALAIVVLAVVVLAVRI